MNNEFSTLVKCKQCDKDFFKRNCQIKKSSNNFCSRNCAAVYNNKVAHKKKLKTIYCIKCKNEIERKTWKDRRRSYCKECFEETLLDLDKVTLGELKDRRKYQKSSQLRDIARKIYNKSNLPKKCLNCSYDYHFEVCHIKAIKDFDLDTTISEVNHIDNLIGLCRNCHWEFDHGKLSLKYIINLKQKYNKV